MALLAIRFNSLYVAVGAASVLLPKDARLLIPAEQPVSVPGSQTDAFSFADLQASAGLQNYLAQLSQHAAAAWAAQAYTATQASVPQVQIQHEAKPMLPEQLLPQAQIMAPSMSMAQAPQPAPVAVSTASLNAEQLQRYMLLASYANYMTGHPPS